jgi:hypothetical protein
VFGHHDVIKDRLMRFLEKKASKNGTRSFTRDTLYAIYQKRQRQTRNFFGIFTTTLNKDSFTKIHRLWQSHSSLKSNKFIEKHIHCPKCNQSYKQSQSIISKCTCGYHFVFRYDDIIKDRQIRFLEIKASKHDTRYFTLNDIYTIYQKHQTDRAKKGHWHNDTRLSKLSSYSPKPT